MKDASKSPLPEGEGTSRGILISLILIFLLRLALALNLPLHFDEAYYWLWSQNLAPGYYDHPPMVALLIRLSTILFGGGEFGVRFLSVLLGIPVTWALWRTAEILFDDAKIAARAALYFNLTLLATVCTVIVTPDSPLLLATTLTIYSAAQLWKTQNPRWWLAIGAAVGFGLVSKYTAFFTGFSILAWLCADPKMRRWLFTPWPCAAGALSLLIFSPVLLWNYHHDYVSFAKQFGRAAPHGLTLSYEGEYLGALIGLLTPPIFILGLRGKNPLLLSFILPLAVYFAWHALHARVQANWILPIFPPFAIAAAACVSTSRGAAFSRRIAVPFAAIVLLLAAALTLHPPSALKEKLAYGWNDLGPQIEKLRKDSGASAILTSSYANAGWLSFYVPNTQTIPVGDPVRWENFSPPDPAQLHEKLLYVADDKHDFAQTLPRQAILLATLPRGTEQIRVYLVAAR